MGYEPEDLPWEVPLIELGLDSLMAVRIKNRVEYDFDLPPIQLTAVRDANLYAVEKLIEYAIEHRDEVEQLHEYQKTQTAEEIARAQAELLSGATPAAVTAPHAGSAGRARNPSPAGVGRAGSAAADRSVGPVRPTAAKPNLAAAAEALNQEAVAKALNSDMPPRDAAERVTFATWAIVTGKSAGGIFNPLPKLDEDTAAKMAQRLSERAEGPITAEDVLTSENIEALADKVRELLRGRRRSTGSSASCGRGPRAARSRRCSCSTRPAARRWCTSRCSTGCRRIPRCTVSSGSKGRSRSVRRNTFRS